MLFPNWRATAATWASAALLSAVPAAAQVNALEEANKLFKQGQFERALERVEAHLKANPKDARGRFLKGIIFAEQRKPDDAIKVFTELTQDYPELPEPYNNLAVLYASQGQYEKARSALEMAIRTHPSYATAHENLGDIYAKMASQAYDKALQIDSANPGAKNTLALVRELVGGPAQAVQVASAAAPAPVEKAPEKEVAEKPAHDTTAAATALVHAWAKAWSAKNANEYLAFYARDFQTPRGQSRSQWEQTRRERIAAPKYIQVTISALKVKPIDDGHVAVTFRQHYKADTLNSATTKTLVLVKAGEKWLIQQERIGS